MTRTFLIHPQFKRHAKDGLRDAESCLEEAAGLAAAIDLDVAGSAIVTLSEAKSATLMGSGKVEELAEHIAACEATLAIVNDSLSPVQQRNLEKAWGVKVIDRTALILEIFGARARTHEGKLQVELASLNYQKSRLVRSWTHLERQRGGFGFLGGPGESQIEIDRRLIRDRISKIRKQLEQVTRTRELHRKVRRDTPYPVVALVGYTNAGKSTLFNRLTGASVMAMDKLFATLDPTMRAVTLSGGQKIILSDTVGFISNLPTELVAAFRATLEEVLGADVLLHVRDISHPDSEAQKKDVEKVLRGLFASDALPENLLEVCNKIDRLDEAGRAALRARGAYAISALSGDGVEALCAAIDEELSRRYLQEIMVALPLADGKALAWLFAHGRVTSQEVEEEMLHVTAQLTHENLARFRQKFLPQ
ncbi:MAG: GTPase HflX [Alphaproteobacteria bacterium]|nr:GTPase HflX [Alphaproteobacteria bacterium]